MNTSCCTNPIRINTLLIKNRIVFPAMCTKYAAPDGGVTERMLRYYEERAKGGAGLVTIEATSVDPTGNSFSRGLSIADDARLPGLTDLARRVKRHGARISIQLQHGGRAALPQFSGHAVPLVSAIPGVTPYDNSVILSEEEIARLVECWGKAAIRAREAGFDAVEIHGAHGYLISQFLSPYTNRRTDGYGGSLENRMRFALEVCRKVRESVGPDFPVTYRMSAVEGLPGGTTLEDSVALAKRLVADGIDALHVSVGLRETNFMVSPPACVEKGWNAPLSRAVRDGIEAAVPVIVAGRVADEQTAQGIIDRGDADMVAMGRALIADPFLPAKVAAGEAGGITQHIGAYTVKVNDQPITFLDTPGHAAFTEMRARGAMCTDIAILVVAADDGIMPQTIEAINHAKAANIPIIVAVNKMDKHGANPDRILTQLTEHGLTPADWGGETEVCKISAKTGEGIDDLLETVLLTAEMLELKANPNRAGKGCVLEARLDKTRGPIATLLVQNGTLHQGDLIIAGTAVGRVRVMTNDKGLSVKDAGPSIPVEITGLTEVPAPGDEFNAVADERMARQLVEQRKQKIKDDANKLNQKVTLESLFSKLQEGEMKELNLIVKADVQGSAEAVKASLEKISNDEVRVKVIHAGVGAINESDILLASTSNAIVVGFNVRPNDQAQAAAKRDKVDIRMYRVIYDAINEISDAMKGMLAPKFREAIIGHAEVRQTYKVSAIGTIAGCYVKDGKITRDASVRVLRDNIVIHEGKLGSLQRFKDSVKEVAAGYECGMSIEKYNDIKEGDIFECFVMEQIKD
mgnify:CR=1 FL=1